MGSGSSAEKKANNVQKKLAVVGAFRSSTDAGATTNTAGYKKTCAVESRRRSDVYDFVKSQKAEKNDILSQIDDKTPSGTQTDGTTSPVMNPIYDYTQEVELDNVCPLCRKPTMVGVDGYGCRVCARMYHKPCLKSRAHLTDAEMVMVDRARTDIGWSCHECDNICQLLSPDEVGTLSSEFEKFDINKDATVSADEYLNFRKSLYEQEEGKAMPEFEVVFEKRQFKSLDADNSGSVDYLEFMKHNACRKLGRKDKEDLVKLLTPREKKAARKYYETFDMDGDGIVYEQEAKMVLRTFYSNLEQRKTGACTRPDKDGLVQGHRDSVATSAHVSLRSDMLMDGDENHDRLLTWEEFLRNQAIYIISSRPNKTNFAAI